MIDGMLRLHNVHRNKWFLAWSVITICLFLVFLGIRVPDLTSLHSSPNPKPRAIIETSSKTGKSAIAKSVIAFEHFNAIPELLPPKLVRSRLRPEVYQFKSAAPPQIGARAPPVFCS